jgi:hypothetical protein
MTPPASDGRVATAGQWSSWLAGDLDPIDDGHHAVAPPGADDGVALGPGPDMADKRDRVLAGIDHHVTVIGYQRAALEGLRDLPPHVCRVDVEDELDVVFDAADAGQPADRLLGGDALAVGRTLWAWLWRSPKIPISGPFVRGAPA